MGEETEAVEYAGPDPRTKSDAARRKADGLSKRETIRCLKRYIAREAYHLLTQPSP